MGRWQRNIARVTASGAVARAGEGRRLFVGIQNRLGDTTLASGRKGTHWAYACKWASRCGDAGKEEERWGKAGKEEEERWGRKEKERWGKAGKAEGYGSPPAHKVI